MTPTNHNRKLQRHEPIRIPICNLRQAWGKSRVQGVIAFGYASDWLKDWPMGNV